MIREAVRKRWPVSDEAKAAIAERAITLALNTENAGYASRLMQLVFEMDREYFHRLVEAFKVERLEGGETTENYGHSVDVSKLSRDERRQMADLMRRVSDDRK